MAHRQDPERGIYTAACHLCGHTTPCRLAQHEDRYLWRCVGQCVEVKR